MAVNLLQMIRQGLPANFADMAGKLVGETQAATQPAMAATLPVILAAIAQQSASASSAPTVLSLLDNPAVSTSALGNIASLFSGGAQQARALMNAGADLVDVLLGDKAVAMANALASLAGLKSRQSASNLLAIATVLVLGIVKKFISDTGLSPAGVLSLLGGQGPYLQTAIDNRLTSALGFASPGAMIGASTGRVVDADRTTTPMHTYSTEAPPSASRGVIRWLPWVIGGLAALFLVSRLSTCSEAPSSHASAAATRAGDQNPAAWPSRRESLPAT